MIIAVRALRREKRYPRIGNSTAVGKDYMSAIPQSQVEWPVAAPVTGSAGGLATAGTRISSDTDL